MLFRSTRLRISKGMVMRPRLPRTRYIGPIRTPHFPRKHPHEGSSGLSKVQTYWYIIIPQTLRRLIPLSINLITRMIKTTSLILMIGVVEVLKVSQQIIEANRMSSPNAAFGIYLVVFLLYFFACWPISMLAKYLEKRWR